MKYDMETLDKALDYLLPTIKKAKDNGINFNRTQLLSMVAEMFFTEALDRELNYHFDTRIAYFICQEALYDLKQKGSFDFGKMTYQFEQKELK